MNILGGSSYRRAESMYMKRNNAVEPTPEKKKSCKQNANSDVS